MVLGRTRISAVSILVGIVMLLVPALAWMQYQWLGQLSEAERERMQRTLRTAAAQFATDFDTQLSHTLVSLQVDAAMIRDQNWTAYAQRYTVWADSSSMPRLVRDVWLVDTLPGTALPVLNAGEPVPADRLRIRRWNAQALGFEDAAWPDDLAAMRDSLASSFIGFEMQRGRSSDSPATHRETAVSISLGNDNTLVSPVTLFELPEGRPGPPKISILGFTIVRLDPQVVRETMLALLATRHFQGNGDEVNYRVAVVQRDAASKVVWESEPGVAAAIAAAPDVTQAFMGPRPDQMFIFARGMRGEAAVKIPPPPPPAPPPGDPAGSWTPSRRGPGLPAEASAKAGPRLPSDSKAVDIVVSMTGRENRGGGGRLITRGSLGDFDGRWVLMAKHRAGSLEAAVAAVRTRNLMISSGVLMLLTLAVGLIVVSARRAQALARQQMEFVAAVSHELRTPVSVIGAAAGNLADGVVGDPQRVRKYGETIQGEARRLAETVERVLQLAGIAAGRAAVAQAPVSPADLVNESIAACRTEIDAAGFEVEVAIDDGLPNVGGDVAALKSALQNLISNAVKYGGESRWLRVSASLTGPATGVPQTVVQSRDYRRRESVVFAVEDRGMGIDAEDRKHIFEPFYRGKEAVSRQIQGSGLGLNLVMRIAAAHGGRVTASSEPGKGSTFTLALPAVHDRPAATAISPLAAHVGD